MAKIIDNFILIETLGQGHYSETLKGRNLVSKSPVAVKTIKLDQFLNNQSLREMVINEIQILKKFEHANILQMLKMLKSSNNIYLIYEFLSGCKLSSLISKNGAIPESKAILYFKQMSDALQVIHKEDIIHNNISPETIYISDEQIKVKNFLAARPSSSRKVVEPELYKYASPEILQTKQVTFKSDVFSLGLTFFESLKGGSLFECLPNEKEKIWEYIRDLDISTHFPDNISNDIKELIKSMLKIDENERISLDEVCNELTRLLKPVNYQKSVRNEETVISNKKFDRFISKERNKIHFILQNVQKIMGFTQWVVDFPRNLLVLSLLKTGLLGLEGLKSLFFEEKTVSIDNFIYNSSGFDFNEAKNWVASDFAEFFLKTISSEAAGLREVIDRFIKEESIENERQGLASMGLEWFIGEAENIEIMDEKVLMRWLFIFSNKIYELIGRQKENGEQFDEEVKKEQGILANYVLDIIFFKEFFENFIKCEFKLHEQKYFKHVEGVGLEKLQGMLEKKLSYARKQLNL